MRVLVLLLLLVPTAFAQTEAGGGIVYQKNLAFALQAPDGWIFDNTSGQAQGLCAVVYPKGSTWANANVVMYANTAPKVEGNEDVAALMAYDLEQFKAKSSTLKATDLADIAKAKVRKFEGDQFGNVEAVAYVDTPKAIVMLVLTARNADDFAKAWPAFQELVKSYRFLTTDVR